MEVKPEPGSVVGSSLLGITNMEGNVVKPKELADGWSLVFSWAFVLHCFL